MKTLVVYYSKSGNTRRVAAEIAKALGGDTEEIVEVGAKREGILGFLRSGRDGMRGRSSQIEPAKRRAAEYDLVVIGSPVWGWNLVPAVRSYLDATDLRGKPVALFCTMGSGGEKKTFASMHDLARGARAVGELAVREAELASPQALVERVSRWAKETAARAGS
jgi:flavodoxin